MRHGTWCAWCDTSGQLTFGKRKVSPSGRACYSLLLARDEACTGRKVSSTMATCGWPAVKCELAQRLQTCCAHLRVTMLSKSAVHLVCRGWRVRQRACASRCQSTSCPAVAVMEEAGCHVRFTALPWQIRTFCLRLSPTFCMCRALNNLTYGGSKQFSVPKETQQVQLPITTILTDPRNHNTLLLRKQLRRICHAGFLGRKGEQTLSARGLLQQG